MNSKLIKDNGMIYGELQTQCFIPVFPLYLITITTNGNEGAADKRYLW